MNRPQPDDPYQKTISGPSEKRGCGCMSFLFAGTMVVVALITGAWAVIMHSPLPLRMVASVIEQAGAPSGLKVDLTSGSLSSGFQFKQIQWNDGEIYDVRVRYSGLLDMIMNDRLIIDEIHVGKAHITTDFNGDSQDTDTTTAKDSSRQNKNETKSGPAHRLFRIDRVSLHNILLDDPITGATISIPMLEWTGFKVENGKVELGQINADSDHLAIRTGKASGAPYQSRFDVTLMPKLNERIRKPIFIRGEFGYEDDVIIADIRAFEDTLRVTTAKDKSLALHASGLDLADYINLPLPNRIRLDVEFGTPESKHINIPGGAFQLGPTDFVIQPGTGESSGMGEEIILLTALGRHHDTAISYQIIVHNSEVKDGGDQSDFRPLLFSDPPHTPETILAMIFHQSLPDTLDEESRAKLGEIRSSFRFKKE